ncbi:Sperm motility kinase Y [Holothuria leucospilota]|uniref:Sperm motility kinase Y n=1 Tax=Holothuria leucospilota TaxID=206669 RepID=A0A9Q1H6V0_HOLLE|nr:Sperm motility kinase Y [Holothuria leucospilota]
MASMVLAIHQHGWVHTDLKPANLLICGQNQLKGIGFGLAVKLLHGECEVSNAGDTPLWNYPPEKLYGRYDLVQATVWSVGVMFCYMLVGKLPFSSLILANEYPPRWPDPSPATRGQLCNIY